MTKAPKNSTPTDDELRDELRYWPEWIDWGEAQEHVADIGPHSTHQTRAEHAEIILRERTAAEALRRRVISGDIEFQSESGGLTLEDFRAATFSEYTCELHIGRLGISNYEVRLRRAHVYQFFPTRWMGADGKARLEPRAAPSAKRPRSAPSTEKPRSAPTAERRVQAERQKKLGPKVKKAADAVLALTRQGRTWGWSERDALLTKVQELAGDKSLHISTLKRALRYLRDQRLITEEGIAALDQVGSEPT